MSLLSGQAACKPSRVTGVNSPERADLSTCLQRGGTPGLEIKSEICDEPSAPPVIPPDPRAALSFSKGAQRLLPASSFTQQGAVDSFPPGPHFTISKEYSHRNRQDVYTGV